MLGELGNQFGKVCAEFSEQLMAQQGPELKTGSPEVIGSCAIAGTSLDGMENIPNVPQCNIVAHNPVVANMLQGPNTSWTNQAQANLQRDLTKTGPSNMMG
ncbi:MAG: hypothetical protein MRY79_00840 [Alphaproteobacteria bacterium]|nr:hypothetical protein [Alphaproteobacteria bacterium]